MGADIRTGSGRRRSAARRGGRLAIAVVLCALAMGAAPAGASAAPQWFDGVSTNQYFANCSGTTGYVQSYVSYWGEADGSYPLTGQRYWGKITVGIVGNPCAGGEWVSTDMILPAHTSFDLTGGAGGNVRCYYTSGISGGTSEVTNDPNAHCTQNPGPGLSGHGKALGARVIPSFGIFEIIFPVKTTQRLQGSATNDRMVAPIMSAIGSPDFVAPQQYVWVGQGATAPAATSPPTISGTAQVGQALTSSNGTWSGTTPISYSRQWRRCDSGGGSCTNIPGATAQSYTPVNADQGHRLRVAVTAQNSAGSSTAVSAATGTVATGTPPATPPANTSPPTISGTAQVGQELDATSGSWSGSPPISYSYQWLRCDAAGDPCSDVHGATSSSYTPSAADVGKRLRVRVRAQNSAGSANAHSAPSAIVAEAPAGSPVSTGPPAISGQPAVGGTLSVTDGSWSGDAPITYTRQWRRCDGAGGGCVNIPGAGGSTYQPVAADAGKRLRVKVRAENAVGSANAISDPTSPVSGGGSGDTTAPVVKITKGPPKKTAKPVARFKFKANEKAKLACKLDSKPFKSCTSPAKLKRLKPGRHVFRVRGTDQAGNVGKPARWAWKVTRR